MDAWSLQDLSALGAELRSIGARGGDFGETAGAIVQHLQASLRGGGVECALAQFHVLRPAARSLALLASAGEGATWDLAAPLVPHLLTAMTRECAVVHALPSPDGAGTVIDIGGVLPSGTMFIIMLLLRPEVSGRAVERLKPLALNIKLAVLAAGGEVAIGPSVA